MKKIKVAVLYGGISGEHEVSVMSATSVMENIDKDISEILPIKISKKGQFNLEEFKKADVIFPILHGIGGEDGSIQGFCEVMQKPYAGCGIESSALALDKIKSKIIWQNENLPIPRFFSFTKEDWQENKTNIINKFQLPAFVKPFNTGSSLGISKVTKRSEIIPAVKTAFKISDQIIIEESIEDMRELEVGIIGNDKLIVSDPGEVIASENFYTFHAKYESNSKIIIPAKLSKQKNQEIKLLAEKAYRLLGCQGFARVDLFLEKNGKIYLNEINTIPGFTEISMFPKLMENSGLSFKNLLTKIIELGLK